MCQPLHFCTMGVERNSWQLSTWTQLACRQSQLDCSATNYVWRCVSLDLALWLGIYLWQKSCEPKAKCVLASFPMDCHLPTGRKYNSLVPSCHSMAHPTQSTLCDRSDRCTVWVVRKWGKVDECCHSWPSSPLLVCSGEHCWVCRDAGQAVSPGAFPFHW